VHFKIKTIKGRKYLYLIENQRINGKVVQVMQKCVGSPDKVNDLLASKKPARIASFSFGKPAAFLKAAKEVGLTDSINRNIDRKKLIGLTPAQYLLLIIIGRSEHALSRNVLDEYFKESSLQFFWNPKYKLSSQNFLNYMNELDEKTIQNIELDISRSLIKRGLKPTRLIFDTTNFYTHIDRGEGLPQKGNSKEKRYDKNLIGVGLTTSDHNIPFNSFVYPANENDTQLFSDLIDNICKRLQDIDIPAKDIAIVFDRGMNSTENIQKAVERMHVVGSLPESMCRDLFQIPVSEFNETWTNSRGNTLSAYRIAKSWYGRDFIGVIRYNERTKQKQLAEWNRVKNEILNDIENIKLKLNRNGKGRKLTPKGLINRIVDTIPKQCRSLFDYKVVEVDRKMQLDFQLNETRAREHVASMGKTIIFTDMMELTSRQISELYDSRNLIETDIAWLKDRLLIPLKPTYVRKDSKIRAHVFLCVVGILLYNYLLYVINDSELSIERLAHYLDQVRLGVVYNAEDHQAKRTKFDFVVEDMNKSTADIFSKLQLGQYLPE
jgi:transposase